MGGAGIAGTESYFGDRISAIGKQLLNPLDAHGDGIFLDGPSLPGGENARQIVVRLTEMLLDASRKLQAAFLLTADMVDYGILDFLNKAGLAVGNALESGVGEGGVDARPHIRIYRSIIHNRIAEADVVDCDSGIGKNSAESLDAMATNHISYIQSHDAKIVKNHKTRKPGTVAKTYSKAVKSEEEIEN